MPSRNAAAVAARARVELSLDAAAEVARISAALRTQVGETLRRRGAVVAMSGGVDSSVCAALAVQAFGASRVFALMLPERDSDPESLPLARGLAEQLGIPYEVQDIAPVLEAAGCYARRDAAIRTVVPEYGPGWAMKIVLPKGRLDAGQLSVYLLAVRPPGGDVRTVRLPAPAYLGIVAATNLKQRVRTMLAYFHADRLHHAVVGTPNRLEYDQGFFVKGGDGLADVKPIAHLYKTQVYQLAAHLGVSAAVTDRVPTTDTYSLPQTQEEFYFSLPAATMDLVLRAHTLGREAAAVAGELGLDAAHVTLAYRDIEQKRATTRYLHTPPLLVEPAGDGG